MTASDALIRAALSKVGPKPLDTANQSEKKRYSELMSQAIAAAVAQGFRDRGLAETRPALPGVLDRSGAERRLAGGLGAKKVDVSWVTEESGLLLGVSIKTINFRDQKTKNFQKNITNRRGDMLFEAVTLHQRFPYAVLMGLLCLDSEAAGDATKTRRSTFANVHPRFRLFSGRNDPAGRNEQFERFYVALVQSSGIQVFRIGEPENEISLDVFFNEALNLLAERNPDFYQVLDGRLVPAN